MLFTVAFVVCRFLQILTLIPTMGMLAWFVNGYNSAGVMTPDFILVLFIVSVLALAWAIFTLFAYHRSSTNAMFVAIIDLAFVGAFIAGVYYLRGIASANCTNLQATTWQFDGALGSATINGVELQTDKTCAMLKASFAFGIINCILFAFTALAAALHGGRMSSADKRHYRDTHYARHGHRHRSGSRRAYV
jgi:sugar phosphate permease